jgi:hypothetical protein
VERGPGTPIDGAGLDDRAPAGTTLMSISQDRSLDRTAIALAALSTLAGLAVMAASTLHFSSHLPGVLLAWLGASLVTGGMVAISLAHDTEGSRAAAGDYYDA